MNNIVIALILLAFVACGKPAEPEVKYNKPPPPATDGGSDGENPPPPPPPPADAAFAAVKPKIDEACGKCHNGIVHPLKFDVAAKFKTSKVKTRITNGSMPPNGPLKADLKQALLDYLNS